MSRKSIGARLRFEIVKRDEFRCRYCGVGSADAQLVVDHVVPVAAGGTNSPANLVTACAPCNSGKAAIDLDVINAPEMTAGSWQLREDPVFRLAFTLIARYLVAHYQSGPLDEDEANEVARCVHVHGYWSVETFARLMLDGSDHGDRSFIIRLGKEIDDFDRWNAEWQAAYALRNAAVAGVG